MIDAQALLDYLDDLDNESAEEIIQRFEQAKLDSADSWILDGDAWMRRESE